MVEGSLRQQPNLVDQLSALAQGEAARHKPDEERGGCTCGFCAWSVEHVAIMSVREACRLLPLESLTMSAKTFATELVAARAAARQETAQLLALKIADERIPRKNWPSDSKYWYGYDAAICDALDAVGAALARETAGKETDNG